MTGRHRRPTATAVEAVTEAWPRCTWQDPARCPVHGEHLSEAEQAALASSLYAQLEELQANLREAGRAILREVGELAHRILTSTGRWRW